MQVAAENFPDIDAEIDFLDRNGASCKIPKHTHFYKQFSIKVGIYK